jgi:hypothetical protein
MVSTALAAPQLAFGQAREEAPTKASCAQAYESAQESRASGQLQETRQRLAFCAQEECPSFVQKDCARWLIEVDRELPSVVVTAPGLDPAAAAEVVVKIDGQIVARGLSGEAVAIDPGSHELVLESPGQVPVMRTIMAQQGVQKRVIEVHFASLAPTSSTEIDAGAENASHLRPYAFAAWGVGAVGLGVFAVVGTLGRADEDSLRQDCPTVAPPEGGVEGPGICSSEEIDSRESDYKREFVIADVGLVTGLAGVAAGTVLYVLSMSSPTAEGEADAAGEAADLQFDVSPTRGGAWASVKARF